ncbi:hypothetical protein C6A85_35655, partial [Mycobacterium sp. ITM-2017-0098]
IAGTSGGGVPEAWLDGGVGFEVDWLVSVPPPPQPARSATVSTSATAGPDERLREEQTGPDERLREEQSHPDGFMISTVTRRARL